MYGNSKTHSQGLKVLHSLRGILRIVYCSMLNIKESLVSVESIDSNVVNLIKIREISDLESYVVRFLF